MVNSHSRRDFANKSGVDEGIDSIRVRFAPSGEGYEVKLMILVIFDQNSAFDGFLGPSARSDDAIQAPNPT